MKRFVFGFIGLLFCAFAFLSWISLTQSGLQWVYRISTEAIGPALQVDHIEGRLLGPLTLTGINYQQDDGLKLNAGQVVVDWDPYDLLTGRMVFQSIVLNTLNIEIKQSTSSSKESSLPQINLPLPLRLKYVEVNDISLLDGRETYQVNQIALSASALFSQLNIRQLKVNADDYEFNTHGSIRMGGNYKHTLQLDWQYQLAADKKIRGQGELSGDIKASKLSHEIEGLLKIKLNAEFKNILQAIEWKANIDIPDLDSQAIVADWPDLNGRLNVSSQGNLDSIKMVGTFSGSNTELGAFDATFDVERDATELVRINQLVLNPKVSTTRVEASGNWQPDNNYGQLALDLKWQNLKWPQSGEPWFASATGTGQVKGSPENYQFIIHSDRPWPQLPESQWKITGHGDLKGLKVSDLNIKTLEGEVNATGQVEWQSNVSWNAAIDLDNINPATEWSEWPGKLSGSLSTRGSYQNDTLSLKTEINQIKGSLRDYPVSLSAKLDWVENQLAIHRLDLNSGRSKVFVKGDYGDELSLDWRIDSPDLREIYPTARGELAAKGTLGGKLEQLRVKSDFNGRQISWQDIQIATVKGSVSADQQQWMQVQLDIKAQDIVVQGMKFNSANINKENESVLINLKSQLVSADLAFKGDVRNDQWQGRLWKADIDTDRFLQWRLQSPVNLSLGMDHFETERLCWTDLEQARLCALPRQITHAYQSDFSLENIPLGLLKPWLPEPIKAQGLVNAKAALNINAQKDVSGSISLDLPEGMIDYTLVEGEAENWPYRNGKIDMRLNEQGISIKSSLDLNEQDILRFEALLPQARLLTLDQSQAIDAEAQLKIKNLSLLGSLIPEVQQARGEIDLSVQSTGTLQQPVFKGSASLTNGSFKIPRLGLEIDKLGVKGETDDFNNLNFELAARSGEGNVLMKGRTELKSSTNWSSELSVTGKNFEVSKIPEARVQVSPDLNIRIQQRDISITGSMHVPYARLSPKDISQAAQVSNDVIIVGDEQQPEEKWRITTEVRLTLDSERVTFFGFGFEGNIGGSLLLQDKPGQLTRATGDIKVPTGKYRAYGQRLDIENGRLLFTGGPLTNPGLDFRAVRVINEVTAGLKVGGSLTRPELEVFSIPAMGQTDALSYLVLGRPIETSNSEDGELVAKAALALGLSGGDRIARALGDQFGFDEMRVESTEGGDQASLVVGRYLSPRLYISYGVGLIESINTFSLRYQLSSKWQLKAESGEAQGADLFYTIER